MKDNHRILVAMGQIVPKECVLGSKTQAVLLQCCRYQEYYTAPFTAENHIRLSLSLT